MKRHVVHFKKKIDLLCHNNNIWQKEQTNELKKKSFSPPDLTFINQMEFNLEINFQCTASHRRLDIIFLCRSITFLFVRAIVSYILIQSLQNTDTLCVFSQWIVMSMLHSSLRWNGNYALMTEVFLTKIALNLTKFA